MGRRFAVLAATAGIVALAVTGAVSRADAQQSICNGSAFATTSATVACDGTSTPVTATATVTTAATLTLAQIFGSSAAGLTVAFGNIDALCANTPGSNIHCASDSPTQATWYGDLQFTVNLSGTGLSSADLVGLRPAALGTIPAAQLVDGAGGGEPATAYPVSPASPITLRAGMTAGSTTVTRAFGLVVKASDVAGSWSGNATYSIVIE